MTAPRTFSALRLWVLACLWRRWAWPWPRPASIRSPSLPSSQACSCARDGGATPRPSPAFARCTAWPAAWSCRALRRAARRSARVLCGSGACGCRPAPEATPSGPLGPPCRRSSRLAAVLSLSTMVASHSSATVMPSRSACGSVRGEYSTRPPWPKRTRASRLSRSASDSTGYAGSSRARPQRRCRRSAPGCCARQHGRLTRPRRTQGLWRG